MPRVTGATTTVAQTACCRFEARLPLLVIGPHLDLSLTDDRAAAHVLDRLRVSLDVIASAIEVAIGRREGSAAHEAFSTRARDRKVAPRAATDAVDRIDAARTFWTGWRWRGCRGW